MIDISAETEIEASPEEVWSVLTDFEQFRAWNPFIREARGTTEVGGKVRVRVRPSLRVPLVFHATVLESEANRGLRWRGHVLARWLASGDHWFTIEPLGGGRVRFAQRERFTGLLPWLGARLLRREVRRGFDAMNHALDERVHHREVAS